MSNAGQAELETLFMDAVQAFQVGRNDDALESVRYLRTHYPGFADVDYLFALVCTSMGYARKALPVLDRIIEAEPDRFDFRLARADVLSEIGSLDDALNAYRQAADHARSTDEVNAVRSAVDALISRPPSPELNASASVSTSDKYVNGGFYSRLNSVQQDEILSIYEQDDSIEKLTAFAIDVVGYEPRPEDVISAVVSSYIDSGESEKAIVVANRYLTAYPSEYLHNQKIRAMLAFPDDNKQAYFDESVVWAERYAPVKTSIVEKFVFDDPIRCPSDVKVGLLCDYWDTIFGQMSVFPMVRHMAALGLSVVLYNFNGKHIKNIPESCVVRNVAELEDERLHREIVGDGVTVLIDLNGRLRLKHCLHVFLRRSAPIQIMYFNLSGTSGIRNFDFIVSDRIRVPEENRSLFVEDVLTLPCGGVGAMQLERVVPVSEPPVLKKGYITFASFHAFFKINEGLFDCWGQLLQRCPDARLLIKCEEANRRRVVKRIYDAFRSRGIEKSRIIVERPSPIHDMLRRYELCDIALDTFPYSGGSTNKHAMWQGLPVVTLRGPDWRGRVTTSFLLNAGYPEFIAESVDEYIEIACGLAADPQRLLKYRFEIPQRLAECVNFRPDIVYRELAEVIYQKARELSDLQYHTDDVRRTFPGTPATVE